MFHIFQPKSWGQNAKDLALSFTGGAAFGATYGAIFSQFPCCDEANTAATTVFGAITGAILFPTSYLMAKGICHIKLRPKTENEDQENAQENFRACAIGGTFFLNGFFAAPSLAYLISNGLQYTISYSTALGDWATIYSVGGMASVFCALHCCQRQTQEHAPSLQEPLVPNQENSSSAAQPELIVAEDVSQLLLTDLEKAT